VEAKEAVRSAWERGEAILAVNAINLETAQAILQGAERAQRPIFLMVSQNAARYGGLEELAAIGRVLQTKARVPLFLHLDHAEDLDTLERAFALGFGSAMVEEGPLEFLKEARALAGSRALEVELEVVPKGTKGRGERRSTEELLSLVEAVNPDWIAVDLGTLHKSLEQRPLDLDRLRSLRALGRPLVLHGGSSAEKSSLQQAVRLGVAKVNLATKAFAAFTQGVRQALGEGVDPRGYLGQARERMSQLVAEYCLALSQSL
jgi:fructose-bisphosphate aldolase class II